MKTLYIKDKITNNLCLSNDAYLTCLCILKMSRKDRRSYYVNSTLLSYLLTGDYPPRRQLIESINKGLKELIDNNLITKLGSDKVNEYEIDITNLSKESKPKDYYTTIEEDNVNVILKHSNQHIGTTLSMLRFYVYLMSTVHKKGSLHEGVGFTQLSDMAEITSINEKTIRSYLQKLETMKLVYTYHATKSIVFNSGEIREISSAYGEYKNKYKIIQVGQEYESKYGSDFQTQFKKLSRKELNKTRGLSQKYNHIVMCQLEDKEIPYTYEECKLIYDAMVEYNEKYKFRPERIKDLSVFSEFDFYESS